jgi:hypothetical protein
LVALDAHFVLGDENILLERGTLLVVGELITSVIRLRVRGENLKDNGWVCDDIVFFIEKLRLTTDNNHIGIGIFRRGSASLHVLSEDITRAVLKLGTQLPHEVGVDPIVLPRGSRHCEKLTVSVLTLRKRLPLAGQILFGG